MPKGYPLDLTDRRFGEWTVKGKSDRKLSGKVFWVCQCSCGTTADVPTGNLMNGRSTRCKSCGVSKAHATRAGR